jgi:hypothetical protein
MTLHLSKAIYDAKKSIGHPYPLTNIDRQFSQALITSLLDGLGSKAELDRLQSKIGTSFSDGFDIGYQAAIQHVRERSGLPLDSK